MKALVLSAPFCSAFEVQALVFEQPWRELVLPELRALLNAPSPVSGTSLSNKLTILMRQGCGTRPGLYHCFRFTPYQVQYVSSDKRYRVTIQQRENAEGVLVVWQISSPRAGRNTFWFLVTQAGWELQSEKVSEQVGENLALLGEAGGEVIGFFALHNLIPKHSLFNRAVEEHMNAISARRANTTIGNAPLADGASLKTG